MNKNDVIILCIIGVIALLIVYMNQNKFVLEIEGFATPPFNGGSSAKSVYDIYDPEPDHYDYYDYMYYDWIPAQVLASPSARPELTNYSKYRQ